MDRLNPVYTALSLGITIGRPYLLCALVVAFSPGAFMSALSPMEHGLNLAPLTQRIEPTSVPTVVAGLLLLVACGFVAELMFGLVHNAFPRNREG